MNPARCLRRSSRLLLVALLASVPGLARNPFGFETYRERTAGLVRDREAGRIAAQLEESTRLANKEEQGRDAVIFELEEGSSLLFAAMAEPPPPLPPEPAPAPAQAETWSNLPPPVVHAQGEDYLRRSVAVFERANGRMDRFEEQAKVKLASEGLAALGSQISLPYRGTAYDRIALDVYQALTYLQLNEPDKARVELNRVLQHQNDALTDNARRIEAAQEQARQAKSGVKQGTNGTTSAYDAHQALADPKTSQEVKAAFADADAVLAIRSYENYVNPFAFLIDGLFFTYRGADGADWEHGRKSWERLVQIDPGNPYLAADLAVADARAKNQLPSAAVTYVIFATGSAPSREQVDLHIPVALPPHPAKYVEVPLPRLRFHSGQPKALLVKAGGNAFVTSLVASMDSIVALDFKNEQQAFLLRTILSTGLKAAAEHYYDDATDKISSGAGMFGGLLKKGLGDLKNNFKKSADVADDRSWLALPKEFQYARFDTPADRRLTLVTGSGLRTVELAPGFVNVVLVNAVNANVPVLVTQFVLR